MSSVMVLDGQQRSALAAVRSLGRRGVEVHVADVHVPALAGSSRYASSQREYPDPYTRPDEFVDWIARTARELGIDVVLPITDLTTMLLAGARDQMAGIRIACAPTAAYELVSDKARLMDLAAGQGVRIPATTTVRTVGELEAHLHSAKFPLVLKPARSKVRVGDSIISTAVHVAASPEHALSYLRAQKWLGSLPCLLQEFIDGHGAGVFAFYDDGKPVAWFSHKRLREKPPQGGVSVLSESAPPSQQLQRSAELILGAAHWSGAAMVEFRISRDGLPYLMEINGRLWGSVQLAIDSGIDFPWLAYRQALGMPIEEVAGYATGRRLRWLLGDLDNLLIQWRDARLSMRRKLAATGRFFSSFVDPRSTQEVLRWEDPRPAFLEIKNWIRQLR